MIASTASRSIPPNLQVAHAINAAATQVDEQVAIAPVAESSVSPFQQYYEDTTKVIPTNKLKLLFAVAAAGIVENFTLADLTEGSFRRQQHLRMSKDVIKAEIKRRDNSAKILVKHNIADLMNLLASTNVHLTEGCKEFIVTTFNAIKEQFDREDE